jgi:hypothetical protein
MQVIHTEYDQAAVAGYIWYDIYYCTSELRTCGSSFVECQTELVFFRVFLYGLSKVQIVPYKNMIGQIRKREPISKKICLSMYILRPFLIYTRRQNNFLFLNKKIYNGDDT